MKLLLLIGPLGPDNKNWPPEIILLPDNDVNVFQYTRGEGQALLFDMIGGDVSTNFNKALEDGAFLTEYGNKRFPVNFGPMV